MDMTIWMGGLGITALAGLAWYAWRQQAKVEAVVPQRNPWHCVEIRAHGDACSAVTRLRGRRFLATDAPRLPLPDCPLGRCRCSYVHHHDRRVEDRRSPLRARAYAMGNLQIENRRKSRGRRRDDRMAAA
jgi:hypothetical protein